MVASSGVLAACFALYHGLTHQPVRALLSLSALVVCGVIAVMVRATKSHRPAVVVATAYSAVVTLGLLGWDGAAPGDMVWCFVVPMLIA